MGDVSGADDDAVDAGALELDHLFACPCTDVGDGQLAGGDVGEQLERLHERLVPL